VEVTYLLEGESPVVKSYKVAPSRRFSILVNAVEGLKPGSVGVKYRSLNGVKVVAERAMYFDYQGIRGGTCSQAVEGTSQQLYLAEGYTGAGFDTWILLANPNQEAADVQLTYLLPGGHTEAEKRQVPGNSRLTVNAKDKVKDQSFGVSIASLNGLGIVAERAMYFDCGGRKGGHSSPAVDRPSRTLYLAEGYTGGDFDTWILLANPNSGEASARLTFCREDGVEVPLEVRIPAQARLTVKVDDVKGLEGCSFSTLLQSDQPLLMERSMYFSYRGREGGTNCTALDAPSQQRFFAEGYTGG
jgi:hypothetical protein